MFETKNGSNKIGLGGWLSVWLVLNCLALIRLISHIDPHSFLGEEVAALSDPQSEFYHPLWRPLLYYECACQFLNPAAIICLIVLYARKSRFFPKAVIIVYSLNLIMVLIDAAGGFVICKSVNIGVEIPWKEIGRCLFSICVWVPYFLKSERVKATFIN